MMESEWKEARKVKRGEGQVVMNALLFTAGRLQYECVSGSWDSGSFARKTDRMASVSSHVERGEGTHIPAHSIQHVTSAGRKTSKMGFNEK